MKTKLFRVIALVLAMMMLPLVGLAEYKDLTTVTIYPPDATVTSGTAPGYKYDIFAERGIELQIWAYSPEKTNAILTSGDLPDIMYVTYKDLQTLIDSNMVLDLEPHLDKMPHIKENPEVQTALNYTRMFRSNDTGKVYGIPALISNPVPGEDTGRNAVKVNWPVYVQIGMPEVNTVDDLIPLMKKMMEACPVAADGTKTWGTVLNSGTDGTYWRSIELWYKWFGYDMDNLAYLLETDFVNGTYTSILEAGRDSLYYKGLQFYNKCYLEGVMDPDSINNTREMQKAKVETSRAIMVPAGTTPGWAGYRPLLLDGQKLNAEMWGSPYGGDSYIVVNSKTANLDACLTFIDMFADGDVYFEFYHGREGMGLWEYDENGCVVPTQYAFDCAVQGVPAVFNNGESPTAWFDRPIVAPRNKIGPDGKPRDNRDMTSWSEIKLERDKSEETLMWRERFGYLNFTEWCKAENAYTFNGPLQYVTSFIPAVDEWTQLTLDAIRDVMVTGSWKMVYAQTEEEFEAIWDQMMKDCADLGGADIVADRLAALEEAKAIKDSLAAN